jgi:hypothetical protein
MATLAVPIRIHGRLLYVALNCTADMDVA